MPLTLSWLKRARDPKGSRGPSGKSLSALIAELPEEDRLAALTHSSWAEDRVGSYERLALLGDSVLGLAIAADLYKRLPDLDAGELTKILNQAVSGTSCAAVGRAIGIPEMLLEADPAAADGKQTPARLLLEGERPLPEITEAMIGSCFLAFGYDRTSTAVVEAFSDRVEVVKTTRTDFKSALQESVARDGATVEYVVIGSSGPAHQRTYEVGVKLGGEEIGRGSGRSKKAAGQAAAAAGLEALDQPVGD
ncbi:MAG: ribonuclease III [Thermoleophilia bacterium]|nr:ribonuclease III [Thermoleophilia bacterium]